MKSGSSHSGVLPQVREVLDWLERTGTESVREGMARYAIPSDKAFGVQVSTMQKYAKARGHDHELALALWETGWYEARMLCSFLDDPKLVTAAQMDRWAKEFENWAVCDSLCFCLFDRTPHAWNKIEPWSRKRDEYVKRGAFALLAGLSLHDKRAGDEPFLRALPLIEAAAPDGRNFVKKGVSWALRVIGRRSPALNAATIELSRGLSESEEPAARWIGKGAFRELTSPLVQKKVAAKRA